MDVVPSVSMSIAKQSPRRESEVACKSEYAGSSDIAAEKADGYGINGDRGENADDGEEDTGSKSEPAALSSGVDAREPEGMQTPGLEKVCVAEENEGVGLGLGRKGGWG